MTTKKYIKVKREKDDTPENEIRLTGTNYVGKYITYAGTLLLEQQKEEVILKATGIATKGACLVAEILRHRIVGLHQLIELKTITVTDEYEPLEEGLDHVTVERKLAVLEIHLSTKDDRLDTNAPGYQAPLPKEEVQEEELKDLLRRGGGRGEGRGGRRGGRRGGDRRGGDRRGGNRRGDRDDEDRDDDRGEGRGGRRGGRRGDRRGRGGRGGRREGEAPRGRGTFRGRGGRGGDRGDRGDRAERGERRGGEKKANQEQ